MTTISSQPIVQREFGSSDYPTRDGRPMGESDVHRDVMFETIETLKAYYAGQQVYVTGNLLLFYRPGDRHRHISPDVMVVKGAPLGRRLNYLLWEEGRAPNVVVEITSPSTRNEDLKKKFEIYRDVIVVNEYFLFDPKDEYLSPRLQGFRLVDGQYAPVEMLAGRLPSLELGLHLEAAGEQLRLYHPGNNRWLPNLQEMHEQAEEDKQRAEQERQRAEEDKRRAEKAKRQAEEESARLRREVEELRQRLADGKQ